MYIIQIILVVTIMQINLINTHNSSLPSASASSRLIFCLAASSLGKF